MYPEEEEERPEWEIEPEEEKEGGTLSRMGSTAGFVFVVIIVVVALLGFTGMLEAVGEWLRGDS